MNLINLIPHAVTLRDLVGTDTVIPSSGNARVSTTPGQLRSVEGIPVPVYGPTTYGDVVGLPEPQEGTCYIVSLMVKDRCQHRPDVLAPGTGPNDNAVRQPDTLPDGSPNPRKGQIIAVTRLVAAV
jgi:hypothetical protein